MERSLLRSPLLLILMLALLVRIAAGVVAERQAQGGVLFPDSANFIAVAESLRSDGALQDEQGRAAWRTPAYSIALAGWESLGLPRRGLNLLLDLANMLLLLALARHLFPGEARVGGLAAALYAFSPTLVVFSSLILAETLSVTAVLLVLLAAAGAWRGGGGRALLLGLALAFAALVKASLGALGVPVALWLLLVRRQEGRDRLRPLTLLALGFVLGMAPWWLRNAMLFGAPVPLSTMGGFTLYESIGPGATGGPNNNRVAFPARWQGAMALLARGVERSTAEVPLPAGVLPGYVSLLSGQVVDAEAWSAPHPEVTLLLVEGENRSLFVGSRADLERYADRLLRRESLAVMRADPWRILALVPTKLARLWRPWPNWEVVRHPLILLVFACATLPIFHLAPLSLGRRRERSGVLLLLLPPLYLSLVHGIFMGSLRYRLPAEVCLMLLAAATFAHLLRGRETG